MISSKNGEREAGRDNASLFLLSLLSSTPTPPHQSWEGFILRGRFMQTTNNFSHLQNCLNKYILYIHTMCITHIHTYLSQRLQHFFYRNILKLLQGKQVKHALLPVAAYLGVFRRVYSGGGRGSAEFASRQFPFSLLPFLGRPALWGWNRTLRRTDIGTPCY